MQSNLFDPLLNTPKEILPFDGSAVSIPDFLPPNEVDILMHTLTHTLLWHQDHIHMYGKSIPIPRLNAWYGDPGMHYAYSGIQLKPNPWTPELLYLKTKIENFTGHHLNSVLANLYRNENDSVAWHSDDEPELGPQPLIASLSLGATRWFKLRHKKSKTLIRIPLTSGSLLIMKGDCQHAWEHEIPKTKQKTKARINLTFRKIILPYPA
jgi:alkylated DNA repair dioxygenase AlkB